MKKIAYPAQITLGALFIAAAIGKAMMFNTFVNEIDYYMILPSDKVLITAGMLLVSEITIGIWLLFSNKPIIFAVPLLAIFMLAKWSVSFRGIDLTHCNCFGTLLSLPLWASYAMGGVMIGLAWLSAKAEPRPSTFSWHNVWNKLKWSDNNGKETG